MTSQILTGSLKRQVIMWVIVPITILLFIFTVGGINGYDNAMRTLAIEHEKRLVVALGELIAARLDTYALSTGTPRSKISLGMIEVKQLLRLHHRDVDTTVIVFDRDGTILFGTGQVPKPSDFFKWQGVKEALKGKSGTLVSSDSNYDILAYARVPNTDWYLIIRESWYSLVDPLIRLDQLMIFILFATTVIASLTLIFGLRIVIQPLRELRLRAQLIGQGNFDAAAKPVGGAREIEDLRVTLNDMAHRVESYQVSLQDYLRAVTRAQEEERARLARELHDVTTQTLIALGHKAQMIQRSLGRDIGQTQERIGEIRTMIAGAIDEVRHFSQALHPPYLEELGLVTGLDMLCKEDDVQYTTFGEPHRLEPEQELAIYRIAQEGLNNARKHAAATRIRVELHFAPTQVLLLVMDEGVGFEVPPYFNSLTRSGHFGLVGMRERAQLVNGQLDIMSTPGKGTSLSFSLPYKVNIVHDDVTEQILL